MKNKLIQLESDVEKYVLMAVNGKDEVSVLTESYVDGFTADELASVLAHGLIGAAGVIADSEETIMEVCVKLIDYFLITGASRWGDKFKGQVELHKMNGCAKPEGE